MKETLYLVDAMAFAFRSYYAIRAALTDTQGRPTNAVYGFARILLKLLREENPSHIAVVFDAPGKTFRDDLYPEYKANRKETDQELKDQFPMMHDLVKALNIALFVVPGVEADDVMGALATEAARKGMDTVLVTGDKDMLQLVSDTVRVYDPGKGEKGLWLGPEEVSERFGVGPDHVVDALALIGDSADNVPGVRGIGEKTAKKLLEKYTSLEGLYEHIEELKGKQKENLIEDRDQAFFSRELVTIKTDVPLDTPPEACIRKAPDRDTLLDLFTKLDFRSLLEELLGEPEEERDYRLVLTEADLEAAIAEMRAAGCFAVDTETTAIDPMRADLVGVSMSCQAGVAYYIPLAHAPEALTIFRDPDDLSTVEQLTPVPAKRALALLAPLLADPAIGKAGHNIKYDLIVFERAGLPLRGLRMDTMVASYLTDPGRLRHNLDEVSLQHLRVKPIPIADVIGKGAKAITFDHVPVDRACAYAAEDADLTWRLSEFFQPKLKALKLERLWEEMELPLIHVLAKMEQRGIAIDTALFADLKQEIEGKLGDIQEEIFALAGGEFTINSPKQLQVILFETIGLKPLRKTKTGFSTDVDVLEQLACSHALPAKVLEYRGLEKLRNTYVEALPKLIHPQTGRIHSSFNQAVAATGRLSSSAPNLQNIPVRTEYGRQIRAGFVPAQKGWRLISADYSQIELRIMAHLSQDENLLAAFRQDADIHRETAARVFKTAADKVDADMRRKAKAVNFGVIYGISAFGLARNLNIPQAEAARFIEDYFAEYPRVRAWLDKTTETAHEQGYVTTLLNRRRYLPELKSRDAAARKAAERAAINTPVQGTAADIIKVAMIQVENALEKTTARLLLQVHDELIVECPAREAEEAAATIQRLMEEAVALDAPLRVDVGIGANWAEIH